MLEVYRLTPVDFVIHQIRLEPQLQLPVDPDIDLDVDLTIIKHLLEYLGPCFVWLWFHHEIFEVTFRCSKLCAVGLDGM